MRKKIILTLSIIFMLIGISSIYFSSSKSITGNVIAPGQYSYTEAKCDDTACQDYLIKCEGEKLIEKTPIFDSVPHQPDWKDERPEEIKEKDCNIYYVISSE